MNKEMIITPEVMEECLSESFDNDDEDDSSAYGKTQKNSKIAS